MSAEAKSRRALDADDLREIARRTAEACEKPEVQRARQALLDATLESSCSPFGIEIDAQVRSIIQGKASALEGVSAGMASSGLRWDLAAREAAAAGLVDADDVAVLHHGVGAEAG
ncbi:hypothetical protein Bequi_13555 [Brachybacterium sp. JHP9]|uniref:DUF222 domain-containing protein n=1 Tax=Brachybacterium equifaecis TaxID=2910770 RepID=A0ABT0R3C0_9MICO|nr:hypothetical protein [Brachybacterium equifaecis]MCL6424391.1 hypothetical protein [Brachybacterium equifaecis]